MPESFEGRLALERATAELAAMHQEQARHERVLERLEAAIDMQTREFGPVMIEMSELRYDMKHTSDLVKQTMSLAERAIALAQEGKTLAEEAAVARKTRTGIVWVAAIGLIGTFVASTGAVLQALLGG